MTNNLGIVIVEDDTFIAMDLAYLLAGMGHDVRAIARTEAEAVSEAQLCKPDLMIVDANLAEGSGLAAMHEILRCGYIPHLYITGDPLTILEVVPDAVIVAKPFTMHALTNGIAKARSVTEQAPQASSIPTA